MKNYDDFKEFYSEELFSELLELDGIRKAMLVKCVLATICLILLAGLTSYLFLMNETLILLVWIVWASCGGLWYLAVWYFTRYYRSDFKHLVINKLVKFIDPNLTYSPEGSIPEFIFPVLKSLNDM